MMKLRTIAHARAGDKGNLVNISVFAYRHEDYAMLVERVTEERVSELFREHITRPVTRYCRPESLRTQFRVAAPANRQRYALLASRRTRKESQLAHAFTGDLIT